MTGHCFISSPPGYQAERDTTAKGADERAHRHFSAGREKGRLDIPGMAPRESSAKQQTGAPSHLLLSARDVDARRQPPPNRLAFSRLFREQAARHWPHSAD